MKKRSFNLLCVLDLLSSLSDGSYLCLRLHLMVLVVCNFAVNLFVFLFFGGEIC